MRVVKASYAGACYGVQRALDMAVEASASGEGASTLGPLIHNPQVVAYLLEKETITARSTAPRTSSAAR